MVVSPPSWPAEAGRGTAWGSPGDKETDKLLRPRQHQSALGESTETGSWASGTSQTAGDLPAR